MHDPSRPRPIDYEIVYDYIREKARQPIDQPTSDVVFDLLVDRQGSRTVVAALDRIVKHPDFDGERGLLFINRCIYTAINPLHLDARRHSDLKRLVQRLATVPESGLNSTTRRLRRTLCRYVRDEKYQCVLRQARLYQSPADDEIKILGDLFPEYSFLYLHASVTSDIERFDDPVQQAQDGRRHYRLTDGMRRRQKERIFEMRRALLLYWERHRNGPLTSIDNPTRLSNQALNRGLHLYQTGGPKSFRVQAEYFRRYHGPGRTVSECRAGVLAYMNRPLYLLPPQHRDRFQEDFHRALATMETADGSMQATVIQAFKKILDDLLFTGAEERRAHRKLERHVNAISPRNFAAILLNLVLGCPMVLYKLEARLTALYIQHEQIAIQSLSWLIEFFEHIHLALVMNFRYLMNHDPRDNGQIPPSVILP